VDDLFSHPALFVPLAVVGFALWFCFVSFALAHLGGWATLARAYRAWTPFAGTTRSGQSGAVGWSNYGNSLIVGCDQRGLSLAVLFLFRAGHPPLFIPWEDISVTESRSLFVFTCFDLRFRKAPGVRFRIRPRLAERLRAQAGARWPAPAGAV
jgi:hypothetical protein